MSDDEEIYDPKAHKGLLQAISNLGKNQYIKKTTRSEPQEHQNEFRLVKSVGAVTAQSDSPATSLVKINEIAQILKTTKKHVDTGKQLRNVQTTKKVLQKPLEKPQAARIKRSIGYEEVKKKLVRWDALVAKNRIAETQVFPLPTETVFVNTAAHAKPLQTYLKSDLAIKLAETDAKLRALRKLKIGDKDDEDALAKREAELLKQKLRRDELFAQRKELSYLKMRESQKSVKARLRNKIKSKKYHKLLKKQKLSAQMKEFELQAKTNPEAALAKLNELEKSRVMERASLRHKNTGVWAKNLQVRAKYDKEVRKDLAEQLAVSRQLTQKKQSGDDDDDDDERLSENSKEYTNDNEDYDPFNPWTKVKNTKNNDKNAENNDNTNYRTYWLERNDHEKALNDLYSGLIAQAEEETKIKAEMMGNNIEKVCKVEELPTETVVEETTTTPKQQKHKLVSKDGAKNKKSTEKNINKVDALPTAKVEETGTTPKQKKRKLGSENKDAKSSTKKKKVVIENGWTVEAISATTAKNIDDIFDEQEDRIRKRLQKKLKRVAKESAKERLTQKKSETKIKKSKKDELKRLKDLSFNNQKLKPDIDEELNYEKTTEEPIRDKIFDAMTPKNVSNVKDTAIAETTEGATKTIDPTKLAPIILKQNLKGVSNALHVADAEDMSDEDDNGDGDGAANVVDNQQLTISQAFEDDDIIADFSKDKMKDTELKNTEINLSMPGWGSWAGAGISQSHTNKNKRLILKLAKDEHRRDENKHDVYINEESSKQLRQHLVSDVPFPFKTLQDYEASIRAPIGRNYVPETAFRMLTRPSVITRKGQVIEPMDEDELIKPPRRLKNEVDKRIAALKSDK